MELGERDQAIVTLKFKDGRGPVPKDTEVAISAVNLLGQKQVELFPNQGDKSHAPSGYVIPASKVTPSTDLDQVLSVLDADTRTRLTILINEAGTAFTGRRADFSRLLRGTPDGIVNIGRLADQVSTDNRALGRLVDSGDRFLAELAPRRRELGELIEAFEGTTVTVAERREALRATLARAPRTLGTLQTFLADLEQTTVPLEPAAREIAAAAPRLSETVREIEPFRQAAAPALADARRVAPSLDSLAVEATPVLQRARRTLGLSATFSRRPRAGVRDAGRQRRQRAGHGRELVARDSVPRRPLARLPRAGVDHDEHAARA